MDVWGDPKTGLPARIETTTAVLPNMTSIQSDFEFNVEMDESLFSVEPPPGYEVGSFFIEHPTFNPASTEEKDVIQTFCEYARLSGGRFPARFDMMATSEMVQMIFTEGRLQKPGAKRALNEMQTKLQRGVTFSAAAQGSRRALRRPRRFHRRGRYAHLLVSPQGFADVSRNLRRSVGS